MKSKFIRGFLLFLGFIVLLVFFITPFLQNFGVEIPFCITGQFPVIKFEPCSSQSDLLPDDTHNPLPTISENPIPVIFDDDGSPDGMIALTYFLMNPNYDVKAVTISQGEAHPQLFANHMAQLLANLGRSDILVGYGRETPLEGENAFPESWRDGSDQLFGIQLETIGNPITPRPARDLILEILSNSSQPVMMFVSGTHTNLAEVLRDNPDIKQKIASVYVMGGAVHVPGNINHDWPAINNTVAEWNIWVDPMAAHEVFTSGLEIHLVPLDATNQIPWSAKDIGNWTKSKSPEATLAGNFAEMMLGMSPNGKAFIWDLVTAVVATDPTLCPEVPLALDVNLESGPEQGQIILVNEPSNVWICLEPNANQIRSRVEAIFN
jgi:purine nucleosidase/pyrimidine-specific ribonucleoside hydrolase